MTRSRLVVSTVIVCTLFGIVKFASAQAPAPDGWVVLPVDEYRALRARANPDQPPPAGPPVEATLTRVDYELRIEGESVAGRALLTIDVLRDGWTKVQIPAGFMVRDARLGGQPMPLVEGPPPYVLLSRAGRVVLALDIVMPLAASAGSESITLPGSRAPISHATLVLPRSGIDLTVTGGFIGERSESAGESRWTAFGGPNLPLTLSWKRKVDDRRAEQTLRTRARITTLVGLGEDISLVSATVRVEVLQGLAREIALALPAGLVVNQVNGATVGDWTTAGGTLRVRMLDPIGTETSFVVQGETRAPREGRIVVPLLRMPSAERETGGIAVDVAGAGEIAERQTRGFEPADPAELGEPVTGRESASMIAFRMNPLSGNDARSLTVNVVRYTPQAILVANIEEARYRALIAEDGRMLVEARYAIRNNQRSFLKVTMPPGSTMWSAVVAGRPIRPGLAEKDAVLLALEKGRAGEEAPTFVVELVYFQPIDGWLDESSAHLNLPTLDLPVSRTGLELYYSPRFRIELQPGSFRVETDSGPFAEALRGQYRATTLASTPRGDQPGAAKLQALVDRFRQESGGRTVAGALPVRVTFPEWGPSVFLASELTAESGTPAIDLSFKRSR
jgi:hypothetical protein